MTTIDERVDDLKDVVNEMNKRLTDVEESCKQAHKRLDTLEMKGGK